MSPTPQPPTVDSKTQVRGWPGGRAGLTTVLGSGAASWLLLATEG